MLDALARWNRWGSAELPGRVPRTVTPELEPFLESPEVVALAGPRRAGKSTVMYQLMDRLQARGVAPQALLHVNLEEPALATELSDGLLDRIYDTYREHVYPTGKAYLFLDEVQRLEGWERWVRARAETEPIKVFVTGSSSALMSRELGTLLTGRHVTFQINPLGFAEYLRFNEISMPSNPRLVRPPPVIQHALGQFLRWGGFPEVVLAGDDRRRELLLKTYFDDLLFKDVAMRHSIRDVSTLRAVAVHLLSQTANLVSLQRVASTFGVSLDLARAYCSHLEEAYLVSFLPYFSLKASERQRHPRKVHACDLGLRNVVGLTGSPDWGRRAETAVHNALQRLHRDDLFYGVDRGEVDLLLRQGNRLQALVQVVYEGLEQKGVRQREVQALSRLSRRYTRARQYLIAGKWPRALKAPKSVTVLPMWRVLIDGLTT